jgi:hypothetical protein
MDSLNKRILKTSTSIVTLVNSIVVKVEQVVNEDIAASEKLSTQLKDVYSWQMAFMARGLAEPMKICATLMSQVHIIIVNSVTKLRDNLSTVELATVNSLQVNEDNIC